MLRIAVWYESQLGRNDGNPLYVDSFLQRTQHFCDVMLRRNQNKSLIRAFPNSKNLLDPRAEEMAKWILENLDSDGIEVVHLRPQGNEFKQYGQFDMHVWVDWGEDGLTGVLPYECSFPSGAPIVYWASDTHLGYDYRLSVAKKSDLVFCAQKDAVERMKQDGLTAPVYWLPHAFEPLAYPKFNMASKKYDVAFVGHVNSENRLESLDRLFREFPNFFFGQRRFEAASEIFAKSRISFNVAMKDDVNMRCFEIMGSGNFLMTDRISSIEDIFVDRKHCVLYDNLDDLVLKVRYYLEHEEEREAIAKCGYEYAMQKHTIYHRVLEMFNQAKANGLIKEAIHARS